MVEKSSYFDLFMGEAAELLRGLNSDAIELEKNPGNRELVDSIFRAVHTLKGMAGIMEYRSLASFLHEFESMLGGLRDGSMSFSDEAGRLLFKSIDAVAASVDGLGRGDANPQVDGELLAALSSLRPSEEQAAEIRPGSEDGVERDRAEKTAGGEKKPAPPAYSGRDRRTNLRLEDEDRERIFSEAARGLNPYEIIVRLTENCAMPRARAAVVVRALSEHGEVIREQQLDRQMTGRSFGQYFGLFYLSELDAGDVKALVETVADVEEALIRPMDLESLPRRSRPERKPPGAAAERQGSLGSTRVEKSRLAHLMDVTGEMLLARLRIEDMADRADRKGMVDSVGELAKLMSELQHDVLKLQLIPVDYLFGNYPRLVRDTSQKQGKKVNLTLAGGEIGLDKRALDALNDPLLHLIRNAVSHGIEDPEERKREGKPEEGSIRIEARRERDSVIVSISDDGRGIDPSIAGEVRPPDNSPELFSLLLDVICRPGFSTAGKADSLAGRGVGMEVVRAGVEAIGGRIKLASEQGKGSTFTLSVPLTLSIVQALLFDIGETPYAMPLSQVREIVTLESGRIHIIERFKVFSFHGSIVPLIDFPFSPEELSAAGSIGHVPEGAASAEGATALVVEARSRLVGLRVDSLHGRRETIVKPMPALLKGVPGLSGATILGDGRVAFVLDLANAVDF